MGSHQLTPLNRSEQILLVALLGVFLAGGVVLAVQQKGLERQLASGIPVPKALPDLPGNPVMAKVSVKSFGPVSLSRGSVEELEQLPGIGPMLAEEIIRYRKVHPFAKVEDLLNVPGIGPKRLEKIKDRVRVD